MNIELFTTTPQSVDFKRDEFLKKLKNIAHQTEAHGYKGILIYSDNRLADPWMITGMILAETEHLLPMIALQPMYMHPYTVAKKISTIGLMYDRPIALNLVAGGFVNDLTALGDQTAHDERYERLCEYTEIIQRLLTSTKPVSYEGKHYQVKNLKLQPALPEPLQPTYYLSGSSDAAKKSAERLGAHLIEYPEPIENYTNTETDSPDSLKGMRIGILARNTHEQAWNDARVRFPETRAGQLAHQLAERTSDSEWHKKLSGQNGNGQAEEPVYWLGPFNHYHTFCPYLVGDYGEVANLLSTYLEAGCTTCILDIPVSEQELQDTMNVFQQAAQKVQKT